MSREQSASQGEKFQNCLLQLEREGVSAIQPMVDLFADDARLSNAALRRRHEEHRGKAEIETFWRGYVDLLGDSRTTFHQLTSNDEAAGLFWTTQITADTSYDGVTLLRFDSSGKVAEMNGYYDPDAVLTRPHSEAAEAQQSVA